MKFKTLKELGEEFKDRLKAIAKINTEFTGILSGFYSLDAITKGLPVMFGTEMLL